MVQRVEGCDLMPHNSVIVRRETVSLGDNGHLELLIQAFAAELKELLFTHFASLLS